MSSLKDKVAIVTGASSGIGAATALELAKLGCRLSLTGRNTIGLEDTRVNCLKYLPAENVVCTIGDLTSPPTRQSVLTTTMERFGALNVLINAAGILLNGDAANTPLEQLDTLMDINVKSLVALTQLCVPHLIEAKGAVVNVSSIAGPCAFPAITYYCMSKAAVDQYTKCLALELASSGVRVNAINPGVIVTEVHRRSGMTEQAYAEFLAKCSTTHALGRPGEAKEAATAAVFLASADSSFITGHLLPVDGGRGILTPR